MDVIERLIEQANLNDIKNLQFEKDVLFRITREKEKYHNQVIRCIVEDVTSVLKLQQLMTNITKYTTQFIGSFKHIMLDQYEDYYVKAYDHTDDMIELGKEVYGNLNRGVKEQEYGEKYIEFIRDHSFELLTNYTQAQINQMRSTIGDLLLKGKADKINVRTAVQKILDTNLSKAEEVAQTELSRAYNYGTMARLTEYQKETGQRVRKYWYGFKYSEVTCGYCRERIGTIYELDDDSEDLPAHVRCRCVWLPVLDGWDKPITKYLTARANMINTAYSADMIYNRINSRLNINYGDMIDPDAASNYIAGDRSENTLTAISHARSQYISDVVKKFDIAMDTAHTHMSDEFNTQMKFWQKLVGGAIADNDKELVNSSYEAIKAITILPWNSDQLAKWNNLINTVGLYR